MSVSLCMIVRNESANLGPCLDSVSDLADETIVVDTGSTDDTREVARAAGARVYEFPWCDDFAAARNESLRHATGDWILWMDADDRLPRGAREGLKDLIDQLPDENVGYLLNVVCPGPDGGPMFHLRHVRLFQRRPDIRWARRVHEQIAPAVLGSGGSLRQANVGIVHLGYTRPGSRQAKLERNLRLLDLELEGPAVDGHTLLARAGTLIGLERGAEALVTLNLCESFVSDAEMTRRIAASKADAWVLEGNLGEALEAVRSGLAQHDRDTKLQYQEASLLAALGWFDKAEACLRAQLLVGEEHVPSAVADRTIAAFRARHLLAEVLLERGRFDQAETEARAVVHTRPGYGQGWISLAEALAGQGKRVEVDGVLHHVETTLRSEVGGALVRASERVASGDPASALEVLDRAACGNPGDPFLSKARARALFARGDRGDDLVAAIRTALAADPLCVRMRAIERAMSGPRTPRWLPRASLDATLRATVL